MTDLVRLTRMTAMVGVLALVGTTAMAGVASAGANTILISKNSAGVKGNLRSGEPSISNTGRWIEKSSRPHLEIHTAKPCH